VAVLQRLWNERDTNLENVLLPYDFFRRDSEHVVDQPLVLTKDGGLMALFSMDGVDPEPLGEERLAGVSMGVRRALEVFNGANLQGGWSDGRWEVQNIFSRRAGSAPTIPNPSRQSAALRFLAAGCNDHWQARTVFTDEVLWAIKFSPRNRDGRSFFRRVSSDVWGLLGGKTDPRVRLSDLREQAGFVRRVMSVFQDNVRGVMTRRPRMHLGLRWLSEEDTYRALWRQVNRRGDEPPPLRYDLPLLSQVAASYRDNSGMHYEVDGRRCPGSN
jgi:hypothetical protein